MGIRSMYPFWSAIISAVIAQALKPFIFYFRKRVFRWRMAFDSGGFPSSHSALVSALALSVGLQEHFRSTIFAVALTLAVIVIYDAANVRYYSGQNIKITQQLVKDVQESLNTEFDDPIYSIKLKEVLGHKWVEVIGGILLGMTIALIFHYAI
ncbi:MAG: divergent PAP2 family protein [Solobacterium sp.]|nr:divergent PAP2 family protein [Erysipelotrichaceae bacterium]MBQ9154009.1 divergent PAP2 family protein [Solobacterium sp.]